MNMKNIKRATPAVFMAVLFSIAAGLGTSFQGSSTDPSSLQAALDTALDDERHALALYEKVIEKHGKRKPFSKIVHAERRHESALLAQYERLGLTPPARTPTDRPLDVPDSFRETCDAAVFAEIENARLYDDLIAAVDDAQVLKVFTRLQAASLDRHLPAFERHSSGWHVLTEDPTPAQKIQVAQAQSARDKMFASLLTRVTTEVQAHGPAHALTACQAEAPKIAANIARENTISIGRTSWKLRNPKNTGPGWFSLVRVEKPETPQLLADKTGRLGFVSPIRVARACLACHGPSESIAPDVQSRLDELYPDDRATGFNAGDLRGWFWVQVPELSREALEDESGDGSIGRNEHHELEDDDDDEERESR